MSSNSRADCYIPAYDAVKCADDVYNFGFTPSRGSPSLSAPPSLCFSSFLISDRRRRNNRRRYNKESTSWASYPAQRYSLWAPTSSRRQCRYMKGRPICCDNSSAALSAPPPTPCLHPPPPLQPPVSHLIYTENAVYAEGGMWGYLRTSRCTAMLHRYAVPGGGLRVRNCGRTASARLRSTVATNRAGAAASRGS